MFTIRQSSFRVARLSGARSLSNSSRVLSGHHHAEHHDEHHDDHGHHHHGPELAEEQHLLNPWTRYLLAASAGIFGIYYFNKSYEEKMGKTVLQSIMGAQTTAEETEVQQKAYFDRVAATQSLFKLFQLNQPEKVFHELTNERVIPRGSTRSLVPGTYIDPEEVGARRERTKYFKDL